MPLKTNHLWQNTNTQAWDMLSWKKISSNDRFKQRFEVCQEILYFKLCMFFLYINAILIVADLFQSSAYYYPLRILGGKKLGVKEPSLSLLNRMKVLNFWTEWMQHERLQGLRENNFECLIVHLTVSNFRDADQQHYENEYMELITWSRDCWHLFLVQTLVLK